MPGFGQSGFGGPMQRTPESGGQPTKAVTSFHWDAWPIYAAPMVESWIQHWPSEVELHIYTNGPEPEGFERPKDSRLRWHNLDLDPVFNTFRRNFAFANGTDENDEYNYLLDAVRFSYKVFALTDMPRSGRLLWLDADTYTHTKVSLEDIDAWFDGHDLAYLARQDSTSAETGFIALNADQPLVGGLLNDLRYTYTSGILFSYREWIDGFVFARLAELYENKGLLVKNLAKNIPGLDVFGISILSQRMTHMKGQAKFVSVKDGKVGVKVVASDCVDSPQILANVEYSLGKITNWLEKCSWGYETAVVVSGGASIRDHLEGIRSLQAQGAKVICVKHSHNVLLEAGIVPFACVLLDPRPITGTSTHGFVRKDLLAAPHPDVFYMVASMSDPSVVDHLLEHDTKIWGWHAYNSAVPDTTLPEGQFFVNGGTSAAMRAIGLFHILGFRRFHLFGFDCCYLDIPEERLKDKDEDGRPKYLKVGVGDKEFTSTGELIAQAQDLEALFRVGDVDIDLICHPGGMGYELWKLDWKPRISSYKELLNVG